MAGDLVELRCRGCWRLLGVSKRDHPMWCDEACHDDFPAVSTEARDALMEAVFHKGHHTYETLSTMFGFTRTRAQQIISKRDERRIE
uniref:RNA polymerase sigma-70 region 4 domain-containing protein n=1 Tax=Streptomyces sp. NBC_01393 TaxID=2903851 RepID=A0AAU3I5M2_9ACTN